MTWQRTRNSLITRYRIIFRIAAAGMVSGVLLSVIGLAAVINEANANLLAAALMLISVSGLNAYKAVTSTVKIIEGEAAP